jgi:type II secretory pathway predicted ATPase ExeA/cell division septation protein DedD
VNTRGILELKGYETFFGLGEPPFSLAPDPRFLFASASHAAVLSQVAYGVERREPVIVVTGEIGTGKTLLCRAVLQRLEKKTFLSVIADPLLSRDDLLKQLLQDFGLSSSRRAGLTDTPRHDLVQTLIAFLKSLSSVEAHAVVIVDEAQHMQPDTLEQIRLLANVADVRGPLLQIVLVGQTDLDPLLSRPDLRQFQQRVSRRLTLQPLNRDEVQQYIEHRLARARTGASPFGLPGATELAQALAAWNDNNPGVSFSTAALGEVANLSGGVPRVINILCDRALEAAFASGSRTVDQTEVQAAADAIGLSTRPASSTASLTPALVKAVETTPRLETVPAAASIALPAAPELSQTRATPALILEPAHERMPSNESTLPTGSRDLDRPVQRPSELGDSLAETPSSRWPKYAGIAAAVIVAAVLVASGLRMPHQPVVAPASTAPVIPDPPSQGTLADPGPAGAQAVPPPVSSTNPSAADRSGPSPSTATSSAPSPGEHFEVVVASFKTEERANIVVAEVTALGLPVTRRSTESWQQVVAGPFASRSDAEEAQQRIHQSGLTGTQIVASAR